MRMNARRYTGRWQRGVAHGEGTMFFADGSQSRRVHDRGRLVTLQDFDLALGKHGQVSDADLAGRFGAFQWPVGCSGALQRRAGRV